MHSLVGIRRDLPAQRDSLNSSKLGFLPPVNGGTMDAKPIPRRCEVTAAITEPAQAKSDETINGNVLLVLRRITAAGVGLSEDQLAAVSKLQQLWLRQSNLT
jgi:hypothetical protein